MVPNYKEGCKRILLGDGFYECMNSKKFRLETGSIVAVTQDGLSTADREGLFHLLKTHF